MNIMSNATHNLGLFIVVSFMAVSLFLSFTRGYKCRLSFRIGLIKFKQNAMILEPSSSSSLSTSILMNTLSDFIERGQRPKPIGLLRKRLEMPLAVLLMRSSYAVADDLNFVPMDDFQRAFFLFRQSEWEGYKSLHPSVTQGDLADPAYFDFISFAQYATISDFMKKPQQQFVEKVGAEGETVLVRRETPYTNDFLLPTYHAILVGDKILNFMYDTYPASLLPPSGQVPQSLSRSQALASFIPNSQLLLDIMGINSFALNMRINQLSPSSQEQQFFGSSTSKSVGSTQIYRGNADSDQELIYAAVTMQAPANLWSQQVLQLRNDKPLNNFDIQLLAAYARLCGLDLKLVSTTVRNDIDVKHIILVS